LADVPVIGITEAALCAAALQGHRFSIIAISDRIRPWYLDCVERFGLGGRLASIRSINESLNAIGSVQQDFKETLLALSRQAVEEDGADVVILAGAPLAGLARELRGQIPVPVVDGISAGIRMAEAVVGLQSGPHRAGAFAPPPVKARKGLSENLDAALTAAQTASNATAFRQLVPNKLPPSASQSGGQRCPNPRTRHRQRHRGQQFRPPERPRCGGGRQDQPPR
jgi:allantoin racemase